MDPSKSAGWNDPPTFSYSESIQHTKSPKRNILNKRIAFPIGATPSNSFMNKLPNIDPTTAPNFNPNLRPPPAGPMPSNSNNASCAKLAEAEVDCDHVSVATEETGLGNREDMLPEVLANIDKIMNNRSEALKNQNKDEHIRKKIEVMEQLWESTLNDDIKQKILQLSEALKNSDKNTISEIQACLMVDYPELCSEFMSAFRHLGNME